MTATCEIPGCAVPAEVRVWFQPGDVWCCRPHWEEFLAWQEDKA